MGTPACTMRGFDDEDFREVGRIVCEALRAERRAATSARCGAPRERRALCERRPLYPGFRGYTAYEA